MKSTASIIVGILVFVVAPCMALRCYTGGGVSILSYYTPITCSTNETLCFKYVLSSIISKGCGSASGCPNTNSSSTTGMCYTCSTDLCNSAVKSIPAAVASLLGGVAVVAMATRL